MGTSPDVGGSRGLGRPPNLDYNEQQQTAQVVNLKIGMGMVPTTLEIPLNQVGGDRYQYQANPSKPNLDTKVLVATQSPEMPDKNPAEEAKYQEILDKLPLQLSLQLQNDQKKPMHERNPKFIVFEMILRFVAKALVWLERVSQIDSSQHTDNIAKIQAFPHATIRGWIEVAEQVLLEIESSPVPLFRSPQGKRDAATNSQLIRKFISYARMFLKVPEDKRDKFVKRFEKELKILDAQLEKDKIIGVFGMTKSLLGRLATLVGIHECQGEPAALIGLIEIGETLFSKGKGSFCYGPALQQIVKLTNEIPENLSYFSKKLLPIFIGMISLVYPTLTLLASGKRKLKEKNDPRLEKDNVQSLAIRLASCLIAHSQIISILTEPFFNTMRIPVAEQKKLRPMVEVIAVNLLILNAAEGANDIKTPQPVLKGVKLFLNERLEIIRELTKDYKSSELFRNLNTAIRQADIALKKEQILGGYFEAVKHSLKPLKIKMADLEGECVETLYVCSALLETFDDVKMQTNFMQIVAQTA